jgi:molybdenum cofactor cytidylyltransferase
MTSAPILIPTFRSRRGHPVLFAAGTFPELLAAPLSEGARAVVHRHHEEVEYVEVDEEGILWDVDQPEDYERLRQRWSGITTPSQERT